MKIHKTILFCAFLIINTYSFFSYGLFVCVLLLLGMLYTYFSVSKAPLFLSKTFFTQQITTTVALIQLVFGATNNYKLKFINNNLITTTN